METQEKKFKISVRCKEEIIKKPCDRICTHGQNSQTYNEVKGQRKLFSHFTFNQLEYKDDWDKKMFKITLLKISLVSGWLLIYS